MVFQKYFINEEGICFIISRYRGYVSFPNENPRNFPKTEKDWVFLPWSAIETAKLKEIKQEILKSLVSIKKKKKKRR